MNPQHGRARWPLQILALAFSFAVQLPGTVAGDVASADPAAATNGSSDAKAPVRNSDADFGKRKQELGTLPKPADLRPTGPINITAKRAELVQGTSAVYLGNVVLDSDTIKLDGDRLELKQYPNNQYEAKLFGNPAHMSHAGTGPEDPSMSARGKTITFDSRSGIADLVGDALVTKGDLTMNAETIHYNLAENGIQASGGDSGQVHFVIPPATPDAGPTPTPGASSTSSPPR